MPRAHAQLSYFLSVRTASLASWGVGIVAQDGKHERQNADHYQA